MERCLAHSRKTKRFFSNISIKFSVSSFIFSFFNKCIIILCCRFFRIKHDNNRVYLLIQIFSADIGATYKTRKIIETIILITNQILF